MKKLLFFATALAALASCTSNDFVGEDTSSTTNQSEQGVIAFGSGLNAVTRADYVGADAAAKLNNHFTIGGFKGALGTSTELNTDGTIKTQGKPATEKVFDNYDVQWTANSAGTTQSNTSDWEYVGLDIKKPSALFIESETVKQTIKFWDYTAAQYDFIAYSTGTATAVVGDPSSNQVKVTAITPETASTSAYTLKGSENDLAKCYIADMVTVYKDGSDNKHYGDEVQLTFRSLASKVRVAIYETIPGYSVKDVKFYTNATTTLEAGTTETSATLFTTNSSTKDNFYTSGTYTVKFPTIGKSNIANSDYNKAHVSLDGAGTTTTKQFGTLNLVGRDYKEANATNYIGRTSATASFAGSTAPYYQIALPNEDGTVLELRVDYTLLSIDGSGEEIKVHGAAAFVPAIYAAWKPNYAYTYIFKISDNTNGWTSTVNTDPAGLYPITFDAVVLETEDNTQSTITTVASPSITTYQVGHVNTDNEYDATKGHIFVQVMDNDATPAALKNDLNTKGQLYTVTDRSNMTITEADVMDALNLGTTSSDITTGRNGWVLTKATSDANITTIPGADGNNITITAGEAAEFEPVAGTTYAYVYDTQTYGGDYYPVVPEGWPTGYYTNAACTIAATGTTDSFSAGTYYKQNRTIRTYVNLTAKPDDWPTDYFMNEACTTAAPSTYADGKYYKKYTVSNKIYGVKVIKIKAAP